MRRRKYKRRPAPRSPQGAPQFDCITKDVVFVDDNITDVNPDAEFVLRHIDILFGHAALNFVGTSHGVDHAGELNEGAVPGILD